MIHGKHAHPKDCPDQAQAASDRKKHDAAGKKREADLQQMARDVWYEWFPPRRIRLGD